METERRVGPRARENTMPRHKPRLTLRIIGYTAVALLFAAGAILWFVDQRATSQAESYAAARALHRRRAAARPAHGGRLPAIRHGAAPGRAQRALRSRDEERRRGADQP